MRTAPPRRRPKVHPNTLKRGGRFEVGNLQALCNSCNVRKGASN